MFRHLTYYSLGIFCEIFNIFSWHFPRIKGDIEDIERSNGRTCVIVDEGVNMARNLRVPENSDPQGTGAEVVIMGFSVGDTLGNETSRALARRVGVCNCLRSNHQSILA